MNNFIKQVIEEKFASKSQQRYFYAQAGKGGKKGKKWDKLAKEFSSKTDFKKIPEKVTDENEIDEIVDKNGDIMRSKKPTDLATKGITSNLTSDERVKQSSGQMGIHGVHGTHTSLRYWAENTQNLTKKDLIEISMKDSLGAEDTIMNPNGPVDYDTAKQKMEKLTGDEEEAEDRIEKMGYDKNLPDDKMRLVENPKKFMEEFIESILSKRKNDEFVKKNNFDDIEINEINSVIKKQIKSLKNSIESNGLSVDQVIKMLQKEDE
jgi:hypothetical protein